MDGRLETQNRIFRLVVFALLLLTGAGAAEVRAAERLELSLEQDAYGLGMGGAAAAVAGGTHALFFNPAGLARTQVPMGQVGFGLRPQGAPDGLDTILLYPLSDGTVFGLAQVTQSVSSEASSTGVFGTVAFPLSESRDLRLGFTLKYFTLRTDEEAGDHGRGLGVDAGIVFDHRLPGSGHALSFALAARDLNTRIRFDTAGERLAPRSFTLAAAFQSADLWRLEADLQVFDRVLGPTPRANRLRLGGEKLFSDRRASVRFGYDDVLGEEGTFSAGAGYHPAGPLEVSYALRASEKGLGLSHFASLVYRLDHWFPGAPAGEARAPEVIELQDRPSDPGESGKEPLEARHLRSLRRGRPVSGVPLRKLALSVDPRILSPNGDGQNDMVQVRLPQGAPEDAAAWTAEVLDGRERLVRLIEGSGPPPPLFVWDGRDAAGRVVPDGEYRLVLNTFTPKGELLSRDAERLEVLRERAEFALRARQDVFSPNGDGILDRAEFQVLVSGPRDVGTWEFEVSETPSNRVVYAVSGTKKLPKNLSWEGRTAGGEPAPDGTYLCLLVAEDRAGNRLQSDAVRVRLDTTPPEVTLESDRTFVDFGRKEKVEFRLQAADRTGFERWALEARSEEGKVLASWDGGGDPPGRILWNGEIAGGGSLEPGGFAVVRLTVRDLAGNRAVSPLLPLQAEYEPPASGGQLTLNLTTVFFEEGAAELPESQRQDLQTAAESIKSYLAQSVLVVKGFAAANERDPVLLSRRRAAAVRDYLASLLRIKPEAVVALARADREPLKTPAGESPPDKQRRAVVILHAQGGAASP